MKKVYLPEGSVLQKDKNFAFIDAYQEDFIDVNDEIDIKKICRFFFSSDPKWIGELMRLRNKIVHLFGLKTSGSFEDRKTMIARLKYEPNERVGIFQIFDVLKNEIILGENDKHLDFRISLYLQKANIDAPEKSLTIATSVKYHNTFGRAYFIPVKPFHKRIVPTMLKGIISQINNEQEVDKIN